MNVNAFFQKIDAMEASIVKQCQEALGQDVVDACENLVEGGIVSFIHDLIQPLKAGYEQYLRSCSATGSMVQDDLQEFQDTVDGAIESIMAIIVFEDTGDELVEHGHAIERFLRSLKELLKQVIGQDHAMATVYTTS